MKKANVIYEKSDGHAELTITDEAESLGDGAIAFTVSDGGGFSSFWGSINSLIEMRDAITTYLDERQQLEKERGKP